MRKKTTSAEIKAIKKIKGRLYVLDSYVKERLKQLKIDVTDTFYREAPFLFNQQPQENISVVYDIPLAEIPVLTDNTVSLWDKFENFHSLQEEHLSPARRKVRVSFEYLARKEYRDFINRVFYAFERRSIPVYLVGGAVRDCLLERPVVDVDFLVPWMDVKTLRETIHEAFGSHPRVNTRFGTATVSRPPGRFDFSMLRCEQYASAGILPEVSAGTVKTDILRRDFTVNAMLADDSGYVYDFMGGFTHLEERALVPVTTVSFLEDPTRILRGWRLAAEAGLRESEEFSRLLNDAISRNVFRHVEGHRIAAEFKLCRGRSVTVLFLKCVHHDIWTQMNLAFLTKREVVHVVEVEEPQTFEDLLAQLGRALKKEEKEKFHRKLRLSKTLTKILEQGLTL